MLQQRTTVTNLGDDKVIGECGREGMIGVSDKMCVEVAGHGEGKGFH